VRDRIAHGKSERFTGEVTHTEEPPPVPMSEIRSLVVPEGKLRRLLPDVESFLDQIHARAAPKMKHDVFSAVRHLKGQASITSEARR